MRDITKQALESVKGFAGLVRRGSLRLSRRRLGQQFTVDDDGSYAVFRETQSHAASQARPVTLVVGFRLKLIRSNPFWHWLFQRLCILTTPFWSGFGGFKVKLWMVDPASKNYLGIYDWAGEQAAQTYVNALVRVLRPLSTTGSVRYQIHEQAFEDYLRQHAS